MSLILRLVCLRRRQALAARILELLRDQQLRRRLGEEARRDITLVLEAMGFDPATTDQLVERTGFPVTEVSSMLLLLEMQGHVSSGPGGLFTRLGNCAE